MVNSVLNQHSGSLVMAKFRGAVLSCCECGRDFKVPPSRAESARYCSKLCADKNRSEMQEKNRVGLVCPACQAVFEVPASHAMRRRYCSEACKHGHAEYLSALAQRVRGEANPAWKGGVVMHSQGYLCELAPDHPFASNGYVLQHRLVMERHLRATDPGSRFLVRLGDNLYLSPEFEVHHTDESKTNNAIDNLECLTPAEHRAIHNDARKNTIS